MAGNRKHGFRRGNRGGFKPQPMFCHGCGRLHRPGTDMTQALDVKTYSDRTYFGRARTETQRRETQQCAKQESMH